MMKWLVNMYVRKTRRDWTKNDDIRDSGLVDPDNVEIFDDISYGPDGKDNLLTVHRAKIKGLLPVIVDVHGGGYFYGDKERYHYYCSELASYGFAVINFNYHLAPESVFPKPLQDTALVMKWMVSHGKEYRFDLNNVFLVGDSAGAQLVSQYAAIIANKQYAQLFDFEVERNFTLQGIICNCGFYDILSRKAGKVMSFYYGKEYKNASERLNVLKYIDGNYPPAMIMTSSDDFLKDFGKPFADHLKEKGIDVQYRFYSAEGVKLGHVFHEDIRSKQAIECNSEQCQFLKEHCNRRQEHEIFRI